MWHEARRSERKVHDMMDAARKRAQRRAVYLAKRRGDPQQSIQVMGSRCRTYRDDGLYQATQDQQGLIPWNGKQDVLIDRFDGRALLDFIRESDSRHFRAPDKSEEEEELEEFVNFERYRDLIKHRRRGFTDEEGLLHVTQEMEAKAVIPFASDSTSQLTQAPSSKGSYSQVGFSYDGDVKEESQFSDGDDNEEVDEDDDDEDFNSDDSNDEGMDMIAKEFGVKRYGWLVYMDKKAKEEQKRQKEMIKGDPAIRKLSRKERRKASQIEREKEREAARITGTRVLHHDPYREPRRSPSYEAYSRSRRSRSRSRSYSPSHSRRYARVEHSDEVHRSKSRTSKIEFITEFGGSGDGDELKLEGYSPPSSPPSQADVLSRPSSVRILEALYVDPASGVSLDKEKITKAVKPVVSTSSALAKLTKSSTSGGPLKQQPGEKKETPQERLKRIMSKQLNKQIKKDTAAEIVKKREQERQRLEKLAETNRFIVNEVDNDGNVVHLTSLEVPAQLAEAAEEGENKVSNQIGKSYASEIEAFRSLAGDSDGERFEAFLTQFTAGSEESNNISPILLSPDSDKAHRTAMHNFFKEKFKFLVTDTVDGPDASSKCIRVRLNPGGHNNGGRNSKKRKDRSGKPFDSRGSYHWPEHLGKFLRFHLYKENKDTQEAIGLIGKMLGIQPRSFGFAGTKDKRSVSTQRVTVFRQHASRLAALNDRLIGIKVGNFCHVKEGLVLGQLLGNRFTVTLRGVIADSETTIKGSADSLGRHGFINYFGLQRFGSGSVPTHLIGAALLRGEWKSAASMILDPREGERDVVRKAREYYRESNDIEGTLRQLPRHLIAERAILQCMKKCPGNYLLALKAIPRTLRMMYVHSYQSYLWNHAASVRVQKYGIDRVVVGDLVYCKGDDTARETSGFNSECEDHSCDDMYDCSNLDETSGTYVPEWKNTPVKAVTAEDISSGNYTIDDVILPMPGSRVSYPTNDIAKVYHDLSKKDAINLAESVHSVKEFSITSMTGSYRRVFQKPMDFEWELLSYTDGNIPLAETDFDRIAKVKSKSLFKEEEQANGDENKNPSDCMGPPASFQNNIHVSTDYNETEGEREVGRAEVESLCNSNSQEAQMALKLSFTLPASSYATMAIRELLKTSTSVAFHKTLNQ